MIPCLAARTRFFVASIYVFVRYAVKTELHWKLITLILHRIIIKRGTNQLGKD